jgi:hypothetical protein
VVYVESAQVSRWNRVLDQLLPTSTVLRDSASVGGF